MMKTKLLLMLFVAAVLSVSAGAAEITIVNPGFEDPELADGDHKYYVTGWQEGFYELASTNPNAWVGYPWGTGTVNPDADYGYEGVAPEGENVAFATSDVGYDCGLRQILQDTLQAGTTYELIALVGNPSPYNLATNGSTTTCDYRIELVAGGVVVASTNDNGLGQGDPSPDDATYWTTAGLSFTTDAGHEQIGEPLEIRLIAVEYTLDYEVNFDDIRLNAYPDPMAPSPYDGEFLYPGDVELSWTNLDPNEGVESVFVDVFFGTEPNETHPDYHMDELILDPVSGQDVTSVIVSATTDGETYYWQVNSYIYGDPTVVDYDIEGNDPNKYPVIKGCIYRFHATTDIPIESVDAGMYMITWSGEGVQLDATVVDDGVSALTYLWTATPDYGVVFAPNKYVEDPTVTIAPDASLIAVVNPGFENPVLPDGSFVNHTQVEGWAAGYYGLDSGTWYYEPGQESGVINPDIKYGYDGEAPEGQNIATIETFSSYRMGLNQDLSATLQANTTYYLSLKAGTPDVPQVKGGYAVELLAGHIVILKIEGSAPPEETWVPVSKSIYIGGVSESDPNFALIGSQLKIRLLTAGDVYGQGSDLNFDDVWLTSTSDTISPDAVSVNLKLEVSDDVSSDSDRLTIDVYENECMAARFGLSLGAENPSDIVGDPGDPDPAAPDCDTDIEDFTEMVSTWLDDKTIEAHHKPAGDIYFDDFDGDGLSTLDGTAPDIRPSDETWLSAPEWADDGTNSASWISALLPFVPSGDNVYQLSATIDVTEGDTDWFALGFAQDNNTKNWIESTNPVGWILNRANGASRSSLGPDDEGSVNHETTNEPYDFMMELDTNPELWTVEWFAAPAGEPLVSIRGPEAFTENPAITHVAFGASGGAAGAVRGSVDNFKLHEGPLPPPPGYLVDAGASWATWAGEPITLDDAAVIPTAETYNWTADPDTDVEITDATTLTPTVTFTGSTTDNPTIIELTLDVTFSDIDPESDTMKIYVYDDSCKAVIGAGEEYDAGDFDADCDTDIEDFAEMALTWLVDYTLTEPAEKP